MHCDIGFYANPTEKVVTVQIDQGETGALLVSRDVPLKPFNYCGNGIAQIIATTSDAGAPQLSDAQYLNVCGSL